MKKIIVCLFFLFFFTACDKNFEEINTDSNNPSIVATSGLLTGAERGLVRALFGMNTDWGFGYIPQVYVQYWAATLYTNTDRYELAPYDFSPFYTNALADFQRIIELNTDEKTAWKAAASGPNVNQIAVARILKAYTFLNLTDIWGGVPYRLSLQGSENFSPAYDKQEFIYANIIEELTIAADQIDVAAGSIEGDVIYAGDMNSWRVFANSLRLRIGMRMSNVDPGRAKKVVQDALQAGVFTTSEQSALYRYLQSAPNNNPWQQQFDFGAPEYACSDVLINKLVALNDPRLEVYAQPSEAKGIYVGMPYGINSADAGSVGYSNISLPGSRLLKADEPAILIGYSEVLFLQAEAVARGWTNGDASQLYAQAIKSSFKYWGVDLDQSSFNAYMMQPDVVFNQSNFKKSIGEQKWLSLYMQGPEAWAEWRRLGYPQLQPAVAAVANRNIPRRKAYPYSEFTLNKANYEAIISLQGADAMETRLWWDVQ